MEQKRVHRTKACGAWGTGDFVGDIIEAGPDYKPCDACYPVNARKPNEVPPSECPTPQLHNGGPFRYCPNCQWKEGDPGLGKVQDVFDKSRMLQGDWSQEPNAPELRWWDLAKALGADHEVEHSRTCTRWVRHTLTLNGRFVLWELTGEELASETLDAQEGRLNTHARILVQHVYGVPGLAALPLRVTPLQRDAIDADRVVRCRATKTFDNVPAVSWTCGYTCAKPGVMAMTDWNGKCPGCDRPVEIERIGP